MTTLTATGELRENVADHAAAAVHALAHMSSNGYRDPSGTAIASAAKIVGHVAEHGITDTADGLTTELPELGELVVDAPIIELDQQARERLTTHMLSGRPIRIDHAGGNGHFQAVSIAADHAKVRMVRDKGGLAPSTALHYKWVDGVHADGIDTTADLTPVTVNGHTEYREEDRWLAQDLASTLGSLERAYRATEGHDIIRPGDRATMQMATLKIKDALKDLRRAADREKPTLKVGDRVRCTGDRARDGNLDGTGTITGVLDGLGHDYFVKLDDLGLSLTYRAAQVTKLDDPRKTIPDTAGRFTTGDRIHEPNYGFGTVTNIDPDEHWSLDVKFDTGQMSNWRVDAAAITRLRPLGTSDNPAPGDHVYVTSDRSIYGAKVAPGKYTVEVVEHGFIYVRVSDDGVRGFGRRQILVPADRPAVPAAF